LFKTNVKRNMCVLFFFNQLSFKISFCLLHELMRILIKIEFSQWPLVFR
jgi:hypothetical protein